MSWTAEQVLELAPDDRSAQAGRKLATLSRWSDLGSSDRAVWGHCQGSGKKPYRTRIDLSEPAFKCSCPSRKFPCKHGLALFLLFATGDVPASDPPDWVTEWLQDRDQRVERKAKRQAADKPADPEAQKKRAAAREAKAAGGMEQLGLWLRDLLRQGLAAARTQPHAYWSDTAARMIDAQIPGITRRVEELGGLLHSGDGWETRTLEAMAGLELLRRSFARRDALPPETVADIRAQIGWSQPTAEVLKRPAVTDRWCALGRRVGDEGRLKFARTWVYGATTGRFALLLDFAAGGRPLPVPAMPGLALDSDVHYFDAAVAQRACVGERRGTPEPLHDLPGAGSWVAARDAFAAARAASPWVTHWPVALAAARPLRDGGPMGAAGRRRRHPDRSAFRAHVDRHRIERRRAGRRVRRMGRIRPVPARRRDERRVGRAVVSRRRSRARPRGGRHVNELWKSLVTTAVVGTDRHAWRRTSSGASLDRYVDAVPGDDPAEQLLHVAALASAYRAAGARDDEEWSVEPARGAPSEESRPACPEASIEAVLIGEYRTLAGQWAEAVAAAGYRVPHAWLPTLLTRRGDIDPKVLDAILGERGRWLRRRNDAWGGAPVDEEFDWDTATREDRRRFVAHLRQHDTARARELVASTWDQDDHALRKSFLDRFQTGLSMDDEPFLEEHALHDRRKEIRTRAGELLAALPDSRLCARMRERVLALMEIRRGRLRAPRWDVQLPEPPDKSAKADGVESEGLIGYLGKRQQRLAAMVARSPLSTWTDALGCEPERVIELASAHEYAEALSAGIWRAAVRTRDPAWCRALAVRIPALLSHKHWSGAHWMRVLQVFTERDARDDAIAAGLAAASKSARDTLAGTLSGHWDPPFGSALTKQILPLFTTTRFREHGDWKMLALSLDPVALDALADIAPRACLDTLRFRRDFWKELRR